MERMDHIESDLALLHRQLARGEAVPAAGADGAAPPLANAAQLEVRLSAIEDQLRALRGKIEESDNRTRKLSDALDKLQKDTDFRFGELTAATAKPVAESAATAASGGSLGTLHSSDAKKSDKADKADAAANTADESNGKTFATPREHYNYAFRLLNQTQYEESAAAFESFTKKYPKDPLVGNAYYWEGETYYIRRDYVNAADNFRKGFEALPQGPKAADNLLKLAMSLNATNRDKEACLVLQQVVTKFKKSAANVADKADQEQKRIGCSK